MVIISIRIITSRLIRTVSHPRLEWCLFVNHVDYGNAFRGTLLRRGDLQHCSVIIVSIIIICCIGRETITFDNCCASYLVNNGYYANGNLLLPDPSDVYFGPHHTVTWACKPKWKPIIIAMSVPPGYCVCPLTTSCTRWHGRPMVTIWSRYEPTTTTMDHI